jgi:hypothetical protein
MRRMIWIEIERMETWACSECAWAFSPAGPPRGASLDEMKQNYEHQRDKEFASHVCAEHPRTKGAKGDSRFSR